MLENYLTEIRKIASHGVRGESDKVRLYVEQLANRAADEGQARVADALRAVIEPGIRGAARPAGPALVGGALRPSPVDGESRLPVADEQRFPDGSVELFLAPDVASAVSRFLSFTESRDALAAEGLEVNPSMLVFGPPGVGKTLLAKYVAMRLKRPLLVARTDAIVSSYLGSTSKNVRALFDHAVRIGAVLLLDEFDALGKMRDDARELGELKRVVISILQNIDAASGDLVLLAATNHEHLLDPAVWRRFSFRVRMGLPNHEVRAQIIASGLRRFARPELVRVLAAVSEGLSGAALKQVAEDLARAAVLGGDELVDPTTAARAILAADPAAATPPAAEADELIRMVLARAGERLTQRDVAAFFGVSPSSVSRTKRK